jgi:tetratricopeptide (TPR) repeat protein
MAQEQTRQFIEQATQSIQSGQFGGALQLLDQALALDPQEADIHLLRGICLSQTGQPAAATEAFQRAIALDPNSAKARYNLAVHQYAQGQKREALQSAQDAVAIDPNHTAARQLVASTEAELGSGPVTVHPANDPLSTPPVVVPPVEQAPQANPYTASAPPVEQSSIPQMPSAPPTVQLPAGPVPGAANQYYRPPDYAEPAHSIPFVENMGSAWIAIGWGLAVLDLALFVFALAVFIPAFSQAFSGNGDPQQVQARMEGLAGIRVIQIGGWASHILIIVWTIIDLIDRRGNWVWMIPNVVCTCCSFGWLTLPIYILAGRNK